MEMVPHKLLMCRGHWAMVPKNIQAEVYATYRIVTRKDASFKVVKAYTDAVNKAVDHISALEFSRTTSTAVSLLKEQEAA